jgi:hypothetical protein
MKTAKLTTVKCQIYKFGYVYINKSLKTTMLETVLQEIS